MPCYDGRPVNSEAHDRTRETLEHYTGALCAILSELKRRDLAEDVIEAAEDRGDVPIRPLWEKHQAEDSKRVMREFSTHFSQDEIELIFRTLMKNLKN